ncbi:MAG: hypothetical protein J6C11_02145 [Spirochaetaceae bacterium]|nr:hypothetical protein [Spirochaetaceae bacterium]
MKKQSKDLVLAGVVLLAVTGLLVLAGCKNDSVSESASGAGTRLTEEMFTLDTSTVSYHGSAHTKSIVGRNGTTTLVERKDYEVAYEDNTEVGTATITITGLGSYSGQLTYTFEIEPAVRNFYAAPSQNTMHITGSDTVSLYYDNAAGENPTYDYISLNPEIVQITSEGAIRPVSVGEAIIYVTANATRNYKEHVLEVPLRVTDLKHQTIDFEDPRDIITKTCGDAPFDNPAVTSEDGGVVYYYSSDETVARVDSTGRVTILQLIKPGTAIIYAEVSEVPGQWAPTRTHYTLVVEKACPPPSLMGGYADDISEL